MEIIESIEELNGHKFDEDHYSSYDGFKVKTNKQEIYMVINNGQSCCEDWGSIIVNDDDKYFLGAELTSIEKVDDSLNPNKISSNSGDEYWSNEKNIMFININTNKGTLQLAVYNQHNGYYSHDVLFVSNQLKVDDSL